MFLKRLVAVLLILIVTATLVASPEMLARQTFAAILGGFAGSVSGAVIGTVLGGLINPTGWGDLVGLILGFIVGAPVGSSLTTISWSVDRLEGSVLLSIAEHSALWPFLPLADDPNVFPRTISILGIV